MTTLNALTTPLARLASAAALSAASFGALAHGGHATTAGVSPEQHLHLTSTLMVPSQWMIPVIAVLGAAAVAGAVRLRKRAEERRR